MNERQMTMRTYKATVRKVHEAYTALRAVADTAEDSSAVRIASTLDSLRSVVDELRVKVCDVCNRRGTFSTPEDPYTIRTCQHPKVPSYDVRTGEVCSR